MNRTNLPVEQIDYSETVLPQSAEVEYTNEQVLAELANTQGWKMITDRVNQKIDHYTQFLPGNLDLSKITASNWTEFEIAQKTAFNLIQGYKEILAEVEQAKSNVKKARQ